MIRRVRIGGVARIGAVLTVALLAACAAPTIPSETAPPQEPVGETPPEDEVAALPPAEERPLAEEDRFAVLPPVRVPFDAESGTRVGLLLPMSGQAAALGQAMLDAATLAVFDAGGRDVMLLPRDTGGTAEGAARAADALSAQGVDIVLGPLFGRLVPSARGVFAGAATPVVAFSNDSSVAGNGVYVLGFTPEAQVARVVDYAVAQGRGRFAALLPGDAYGRRVASALRRAVFAAGVEFVDVAFYSDVSGDAAQAAEGLARYKERQKALEDRRRELEARDDEEAERELAELEVLDTLGPPPFDALLLAESGERLKALATLLPYYDIDRADVQLLGTSLWDDPAIREEPALAGAWFASAAPDNWPAFATRYRNAFGSEPPRLAALAYDAAALAIVLKRRGAGFDTAAITNPSGFLGATGVFRFASDGVSEHGLAVFEVRPDGLRVVDPAPKELPPRLDAGGGVAAPVEEVDQPTPGAPTSPEAPLPTREIAPEPAPAPAG